MQNTLEKLFTISLILSIVCALTMILLQLVGLIIGNGDLVIASSEWLKAPTIILSAVFSGIAFVLGYFPDYKEEENS
ncbi:hypothetical protein ABC345_20865 [Shouchella sp. 1P09AA]|uniref:hypothetical protein n=1 Tax=unclassified Shouchella TaxID=2893065 RepID=UPI0039A28AAD